MESASDGSPRAPSGSRSRSRSPRAGGRSTSPPQRPRSSSPIRTASVGSGNSRRPVSSSPIRAVSGRSESPKRPTSSSPIRAASARSGSPQRPASTSPLRAASERSGSVASARSGSGSPQRRPFSTSPLRVASQQSKSRSPIRTGSPVREETSRSRSRGKSSPRRISSGRSQSEGSRGRASSARSPSNQRHISPTPSGRSSNNNKLPEEPCGLGPPGFSGRVNSRSRSASSKIRNISPPGNVESSEMDDKTAPTLSDMQPIPKQPKTKVLLQAAAREDILTRVPKNPIHQNEFTRYFIIKSNSHDNILRSIEHSVWATHQGNEKRLNLAFSHSPYVILLFSVNHSGNFAGYARMVARIGECQKGDVFDGYGQQFDVKWLKLHELQFSDLTGEQFNNDWNEGNNVKISRDCQELPNYLGARICTIIDSKVYESDPEDFEVEAEEPFFFKQKYHLNNPIPGFKQNNNNVHAGQKRQRNQNQKNIKNNIHGNKNKKNGLYDNDGQSPNQLWTNKRGQPIAQQFPIMTDNKVWQPPMINKPSATPHSQFMPMEYQRNPISLIPKPDFQFGLPPQGFPAPPLPPNISTGDDHHPRGKPPQHWRRDQSPDTINTSKIQLKRASPARIGMNQQMNNQQNPNIEHIVLPEGVDLAQFEQFVKWQEYERQKNQMKIEGSSSEDDDERRRRKKRKTKKKRKKEKKQIKKLKKQIMSEEDEEDEEDDEDDVEIVEEDAESPRSRNSSLMKDSEQEDDSEVEGPIGVKEEFYKKVKG